MIIPMNEDRSHLPRGHSEPGPCATPDRACACVLACCWRCPCWRAGAWLDADALAVAGAATRRRPCCRTTRCSRRCWPAAWRWAWCCWARPPRRGDAVRVSGRRCLRMGAAAAAGHAGLRAGLRLDRRAAVQRPAAGGAAPVAGQMRGALWPDVRSLPGAVLLFVLCLYPYVYLLARTALGERAVQPDGSGAAAGRRPMRRACWRWRCRWRARPWPPARALALMETLADYGVGSYFG
jgi:hypothetical protein